jgi:hypothetical protein
MLLNHILVTKASNRGKKSKEQITLAFMVNTTGTNKWEP